MGKLADIAQSLTALAALAGCVILAAGVLGQ
jgi:hypothetical protein